MYKKTRVRRILEYLRDGLSVREIARILHVSRNTISRIQMSAKQSIRSLEELLELEDDVLYEMFFPEKFDQSPIYADINYSYVHNELKKTGVTLKLLWEEYCEKCRKESVLPCSYSSFTRGYKSYTTSKSYTSAIKHRPGEAIEVDWAGPMMKYRSRDTGKDIPVHLFVATLPYSQYVYVEGTESMSEKDWLTCHVNMFRYFGRSPIKIICDNLKTAVIKHPRKAPAVINESYLSLAEHISVAIIPTQIKKPKQKASVEGSVGKITMHVIAKLRNEEFTSLKELNAAILKVLDEFNNKPFQKRSGSRKSVYETEEKPCMRELPMMPYEVCEWSYGHRVGPDSHIWFSKCQYVLLFAGIFLSSIIFLFGSLFLPLLDQFKAKILDSEFCTYQYLLKEPVETEIDGAEQYAVKTLENEKGEKLTVYGVQSDSIYIDAQKLKKLTGNQVLFSNSYYEKYRIKDGESVKLKEEFTSKKYSLVSEGEFEYPASLAIFMNIDQFRALFDLDDDYYSGYFSDKELTDISETDIATVITEDDLLTTSNQLEDSMGNAFRMFLAFSIIMFILMVFLLAKLVTERNAYAISMLKILGYSNREAGSLYQTSTGIVVVISLILSGVLGLEMIKWIYQIMMQSFTGWMTFYAAPWGIPVLVGTGLVCYGLVSMILLRRIRKIPMSNALKDAEM